MSYFISCHFPLGNENRADFRRARNEPEQVIWRYMELLTFGSS